MKHFTPARLLRAGRLDDPRAFLAAQAEWEQALADYRAEFLALCPTLPRTLRTLLETVYLHDAAVLHLDSDAEECTIVLRPEASLVDQVVLRYALLGPVQIDESALPVEARCEPTSWLYDELSHQGDGFRHEILLSNGWEVRLDFRTASVKQDNTSAAFSEVG